MLNSNLLIKLLTPPLLFTSALHADEAGINDFLLRSAGHGDVGVRYARLVPTTTINADDDGNKVWITSQSLDHPSAVVDDRLLSISRDYLGGNGAGGDYCSIASRNVTTGNVIWRVNACSSSSAGTDGGNKFIPRHTTLASVSSPTVFSLDNTGIFRGYDNSNGNLVLDTDILANIDITSNVNDIKDIFPGKMPRLLDAQKLAIGTVVTKKDDETDESLVLLDTTNGHPIKEEGYHHQQSSTSLLSAKTLLQKARVSGGKKYDVARIVDMHTLDEKNRIGIWVGWSSSSVNDKEEIIISSYSSMAFVEISLTSKPSSEGRNVMVYQIGRTVPLHVNEGGVANAPLFLSSLRMVQQHNDGGDNTASVSMLAISSQQEQLLVTTIDVSTLKSTFGQVVEMDVMHPYWRSIASIHIDTANSDDVIRVAGLDDRYPILPRRTESLFLLDGKDGNNFRRVHGSHKGDEEIHQDALTYCADLDMVVAASRDDEGKTVASAFGMDGTKSSWAPQTLEGNDVIVPTSAGDGVSSASSSGLVKYAHLVECSNTGMTVVFTTLGGMTAAFRFESSSDTSSMKIKQLWSAEEALGSVSSAIFLDETHSIEESAATVDGDADDEEEVALRNLQFVNRIQSQLSSFKNFVFGGGVLSSLASLALMSDEKKAERDIAFGFAKISVLLSERLHRIVALDTAKKGRVVWSMNLHPRASWHKLIHGGQFVTLNDPHGNGGVHDHEMLALSYVESSPSASVEWKCFDGMSGRVFSSEVLEVSSSVVQIVPLRTSTHHPHEAKSCRQVSLLVHSDHTISLVPDTARSYAIVDEAMSTAGQNGLFVHTLDKESGEFLALRVSKKSGMELELVTVGTTIFDPSQEKIVNVAYPRRGEVIQSPSTVLGDDALLLKYLNPHLIAVVTEATKSFLTNVSPVSEDGSGESGDGFYNALAGGEYSGSSSSGQKRKPLGASKPGSSEVPSSSNANAATPSLFVSLVDSVSGQILHRVSHAHALSSDSVDGDASKVPVVISENWVVYTFFNQRTRRTDVGVLTLHEGMIDKNGLTAFSAPEQELSFSSLESAKPIVLSKTFGIAKSVTALGVTTTKAGISSKQFLMATSNDQVISMDRRMLDPRRPNGDLKESEKMEGLMKYAPLLPIVPLRTPSHIYEVSSVESISSASANVESQSLVIAYGGPDVFFTRLAPSKGFDLLPDDFNRGLLTIVLVGLIVLLNVIQRMNKKKMVTTMWS